MTWSRRFGVKQWLKGSLWVLPLLGGVLGVVLGAVDVQVDKSLHLPAEWTYSSSTASTILSAIVGAMAALLVFVIFLDRYLHRLRPVAVTVLVAGYIQRDFARYFEALVAAPDVFSGVLEADGERPSLVVRSAKPGAIQAIDARGLVEWAR